MNITSFSCSTRNSELPIFQMFPLNFILLCQQYKMSLPLAENLSLDPLFLPTFQAIQHRHNCFK